MRRLAGVTDEARRLSVQGEVARFVASVRIGAPPAPQRVDRRGRRRDQGVRTRQCRAPWGGVRQMWRHRSWARLRRSDRPARRTSNFVVRPLASSTDEARRLPVQGEVAPLMAPERIGVPTRNFSCHGSVTPTQPTGRSPLDTFARHGRTREHYHRRCRSANQDGARSEYPNAPGPTR